MKKLLLSTALCLTTILLHAQLSNIPEMPQDVIYQYHNDDFTVCVREPGGEWLDLYEYKVIVDMDKLQEASMVQFDFAGTVEMRVKVNNGQVNDVRIRPSNRDIPFTRQGNLIYFTLDKPAKLSLEVNGDRLRNLHIFANAPETEIPKEDAPGIMYFGPGSHKPAEEEKGTFNVPSNTTVYMAPGAFIHGKFLCKNVENVRFIGRGIILNPERGFEIVFSKNIEIDGITVINPTHYTVYGGQTTGLRINNLKSFSSRGWSDGIDLMSCSDVTINDIFMRNSDDCIAIYTHRWEYYGDVRNYRITNAILWADIAHPINIGLHGDVSNGGNVIENLYFKDIDILEHDEDDRNYQGCMAFSVSDYNLVQNVTFEDVRVESIQEGQLFNMRVLFNKKYSHGEGRGIRNVTFRNIYYNDVEENASIIEGYSPKNLIEDVTFENLVRNGHKVTTFEEANIHVGKYTKNIQIK